jgi:hypothetical protein
MVAPKVKILVQQPIKITTKYKVEEPGIKADEEGTNLLFGTLKLSKDMTEFASNERKTLYCTQIKVEPADMRH